ncbi:MAG TPA: nuclear transport factor 2 family protein [Nitrolancea sp.]
MTTPAASGAERASVTQASSRSNVDVVNAMIAALNAHDVAGMLACYAEDMEWYDIPLEQPVRGKAAVGDFLREMFVVFPDLRYEPEAIVSEGERVVVQFRMHGTHRATYNGLPPTGKTVEILSVSVITLREGLIVSDHCYFDNAMILRQMGLMPSLAVTFSPPGRAVLWLAVQRRKVGAALAGTLLLGALVKRATRRG